MTEASRNLLEQHFDTAFAAPGGIKKLRELILTLAMQGKLVAQDPNDPPASELLKQIEAEKQQLVKSEKIKQPKPLPPIKPEEVPYELPEGWEWVRLIEIGSWALGSGLPHSIQGDTGQEILLCKVSDMNLPGNEKFIVSANNTVSEKTVQQNKLNISEPGTIIFPKIGGAIATNKRRIIQRKTVIDNNCLGITPASAMNLEWCYQLLLSFDFAKYQTGTSVPAINQRIIGEIVIGLPPAFEQHRIVAKIDQLMAKCDELEKLRAEREEKRRAVHAAAIRRLLDTPSSFPRRRESSSLEDLDPRSPSARGQTYGGDGVSAQGWNFIQQHFGELYTVKENVAELRKTILQLAVMGRLVPQDPNDPPVSELLKEIKAEKQRLHASSSASKPGSGEGKNVDSRFPGNDDIRIKSLPPIKLEEMPHVLPKGWEWVRLGQLNPEYQNGISKRNSSDGLETIVLRLADIVENKISLGDTRSIQLMEKELEKYFLSDDDILITRVNGSVDLVGSFIRVKQIQQTLAYCDHFIRMKLPLNFVDVGYLHIISKGSLIRHQIEEKFVTTAGQKTVNQTHITTLMLPLPPLPEQHRIVAKIDQLMVLCDRLEQQIDAATGKQTELLNAVMAEV